MCSLAVAGGGGPRGPWPPPLAQKGGAILSFGPPLGQLANQQILSPTMAKDRALKGLSGFGNCKESTRFTTY